MSKRTIRQYIVAFDLYLPMTGITYPSCWHNPNGSICLMDINQAWEKVDELSKQKCYTNLIVSQWKGMTK